MPRIIAGYTKLIITLYLALFAVRPGGAQVCTDDLSKNNWNDSWMSCRKSDSPNPDRPKSHWLLYEFDEPQSISLSHVWNANRQGESKLGIKEAIIDYSVDGVNWISLGAFTFPRASEKAGYQGFEGPDFGGAFISKILLTVIDTYGDGACASLAEMRFDVNPDACYGSVDACGVCNGKGERTWYRDRDGDGLGDPVRMVKRCEQPAGFVSNADDDCDTGVIGWATVGPIFEENGCTGCHGNNAAGGLNLSTYASAVRGGRKCGPAILTGTTLVDIITIDGYAGCGQPISSPPMNDRVGGQIDAEELALIKRWIENKAPEDCRCPPDVPDTDRDGFCDAIDECPNLNNDLIGTPCDDGSDCTTGDVWQADCECRGQLIDRDGDGVCDTEDRTPDDPCTADGIADGREPAGWVARPDNDCDLDEVSVSSGDLDDFSACVDQSGARSTPECDCGDNRISAGAMVIDFKGMSKNQARAANGEPDGLLTDAIRYNDDTLVLQFPYMEAGEEICLTVAFSDDGGRLRLFLNNRLMTFSGNRPLNSYQPQEFCFRTLNAGLQTLVITEDGRGDVKVDGATYSSCPCNGAEVAGVKCLASFEGAGWRELENCSLEICEGQPLTLGTDRYGSVRYQWRGPGGLAREGSILHFDALRPSDSGLYWIYYQNSDGCDLVRQIDLTVTPAPPVTAQFRHPSCGFPNGAIALSFDDTPDRSAIQFSIEGPDGNYVSVADDLKTYTYSNLGRGVYDVWARWSEGDCPVQLGTFTLIDQPTPKLEVSPDQEICEGQSVLLTAFAGGDDLSYEWSNGRKQARQRVTPQLDGYADQTFLYRVSVSDENGCTARDRVRVTVKARPKALVDIRHPDQGSANGAVTFTFADHPGHQFLEISLDGERGTYRRIADKSGSYTFSGLARGVYDAWIRWDDGSCPVDLGALRLQPGAACPRIRATVSNEVICEGGSVRLGVNKGSGWTYAWSNGAAAASQDVTPVLSGYADQVFRYSVTVTDRNGCTRTDEKAVKVLSLPQATYSLSAPHCGKNDGAVTFRFKDHPNRSRLEFSINGRKGNFRKVDDKKGALTFSRLKAGRYDAWVRWSEDSCPVSLGTIELNNQSGPQIDAGPDLAVCEGQAFRLKVNQGKNWSYRWSNRVKQPTQTLKLAADPTRNSVKRYQVTVTDAYGCRATDEVKVTVLSRPEARTTLVQPTCGRRDGSITFRFRNHRDQSDMEFSITGKTGRYKRVKDKAGVLTFSRLQAGRYDAWVRWGNDACPVSLGRIQLTDRPGPQIDAGPDQVVCEGDPVRLKVANNKNWSYLWSNKVKRPSQTLYLDAPDYRNLVRNYTISVTDKKSGCTTTDAVKVTVLSRPIVSAAYVRPNCGRADGSIALSFRDHRDQRYIEFSLSGKDGRYRRRPDDAGTVTFGRLAAGTYDVWARWPGGKCAVRVQRITLREKGNCLRSDDAPVLFRESVQDTLMGMEEAAPPTVLPNRTGSEELLAKLEVFPNPARSGGSVTIRYFATQTGRPLQIFSAAGQLVRRIDASTLATGWNEMTVDLMNLASGSYFVADGYGNHAVFAIIK